MFDKKQNTFKSPDMSKLQEVVIDVKTRIYIAMDANPEEARERYWFRKGQKAVSPFASKKPAETVPSV